MSDTNKILCAVDLSEGSSKVLEGATTLAAKLGGEVSLVHVFDHPLYNMPTGFSPPAGYAAALIEADKGIRDQLEARLGEMAQSASQAGVAVVAKLLEGPAAQVITDEAQSGAYQYIVVGTHGYSGFKHFLLGSVAERVVRLAACPVLTIPTKDEE